VSAARVERAPLPTIGARVPGVVPRIALGLVGLALVPLDVPAGFFWVLGAVLAIVAALRPSVLTAWALILLVGLAWFWQDGRALDWRFFALLAGVHVLHALAALCVVLPVRGRVQLAVFRRPLVRLVVIQLPVQAAGAILAIVGGARGALPFAAIVGGAALLALVLVLVVPMLGERAREAPVQRE
jgi:hypothetical protein